MKKLPHRSWGLSGLCLWVVTAASVHGQNIILKDGRTIEGKNLRRNGAAVMTAVQLGTGQGEMGFQVATIARIEFPEPPELDAAAKLLLRGKAAEALPPIDQILAQQAPYKDIPGNWWARAALLQISLLEALGREPQAASVIDALVARVGDPETVLAGKVKRAGILAKKDPQKALPALAEIVKESRRPETLAEAWLNTGIAQLRMQEYQPALLAYLHVPVLYPGQKLLAPSALLGSSRAYAGLQDFSRSKRALDDLLRDYPDSPEASAARTELPSIERKLKGKASKPSGENQEPTPNET